VDSIWKGKLGLSIIDIDSTLGRIAARTIETSVIADAMSRWHTTLLTNITSGNPVKMATFVTDAQVVAQNSNLAGFKWIDPLTWKYKVGSPLYGKPLIGVGFTEAPRGALGHWLSIENGHIKNYQCIVASQWNAGPRDANNLPGPYEKSLEGHTLTPDPKDPTKLLGPLEILRTIHSFDPCIGCAVHVTDPNGEELLTVNVSTTLR
jgi:hydrogenase large subunit